MQRQYVASCNNSIKSAGLQQQAEAYMSKCASIKSHWHVRNWAGTVQSQLSKLMHTVVLLQSRSRGLYIEDKIDLLMGYLFVNPLAAFAGSVLGWKAKEKAKAVSWCQKIVMHHAIYLLDEHCIRQHCTACMTSKEMC